MDTLIVKMNSENKIEWLLKQDKVVTELAEINVDKYFGTFCQVNDELPVVLFSLVIVVFVR